MIGARHPVIVGAHEVSVRTTDAEPVAMMVEAAEHALQQTPDDLRSAVTSVRVVKGIWPYDDPGRLVGQQLGLDQFSTATTRIGGNATYDLVNTTASEIANGSLDAAIVCGAESMRTRRNDKSEGRHSTYLPEAQDAAPDLVVGVEVDLTDEVDDEAGVNYPVNFYAMAESAIRHRNNETPADHLTRISSLWARGSDVASRNPHAWIREPTDADRIATP